MLSLMVLSVSGCGNGGLIPDGTPEMPPYSQDPEFVSITDRHGKTYMFRPHMVIDISGSTNGSEISVAGIGRIEMTNSVLGCAKLVKAQ